MEKIYVLAISVCDAIGSSDQEEFWQEDIKSNTQDFLSQVFTTIDQQYLVTAKAKLIKN